MTTRTGAMSDASRLHVVANCRVCGSTRLLDTGCRKRYYLINLDETIELSYSACQDCQFVFQAQYVGDELLTRYYRQSPMLRRKEPTAYEIDQNLRQAGFLERHLDLSGKTVLEIGAHAGAFLIHLHERYQCSVYFAELSDEARSVLASQPGLQDFNDLAAPTRVDLVVLRHVLEHIFDLDTFLNYVASVTRDDGYLYVEVPDWSYLDAHTDPLIFEHLNQFSTHNLILLLRRNGWQCDVIEKSIVADDPATPNRVQRLILRPTKLPRPGESAFATTFGHSVDARYGHANRAIDRLVSTLPIGHRVALYPASHLTFSALLETSLQTANLIGVFDIDPKKFGRVVAGIPVRSAQELRDEQPDLILLFTMAYEREIRESFDQMGLRATVISITQLLEAG